MDKCQVCGSSLKDKTMKFCPTHAKEFLLRMEAEGKLEPMEYTTQNGVQRLSTRRFLSIRNNGESR